jgi:SAM-dependent methyltransferase
MSDANSSDQPIVYACQPGYGQGHKAAKRKFWSASVNPRGRWAGLGSVFDDTGSSLLADAFNVHWKTALNLQLQGRPVKYFAMLHDDVVPEDFWLDKLLDELEATGADLVSAVVPIKDPRGLSSTALDDPDDPWETYRRLTMYEIHQLPETFTAGDCRLFMDPRLVEYKVRPLLVNTGCWVCRMDRPWRFKVHFQIHNRIAFVLGKDFEDTPTHASSECKDATVRYPADMIIPNSWYREGMVGCFVNQVMSEDWDFSRQLARLGCDVRATRKVSLSHMADFPYPNRDGSWGKWRHDEAMRKKWDPSYQDIPRGVDGWLTEGEGRALAELARGKDVLEIGSYCGLSTIWMARTARAMACVDPFDGRGTPKPRDTFQEFKDNLRRHGVSVGAGFCKVIPFRATSDQLYKAGWAPRVTFPEGFDLAFIDGTHDAWNVLQDVRMATRLLKPGGLLAFHDYETDHPEHRGVKEFVDGMVGHGACIVQRVDSLAVVRPGPSHTVYQEGDNDGESQPAPAAPTQAPAAAGPTPAAAEAGATPATPAGSLTPWWSG